MAEKEKPVKRKRRKKRNRPVDFTKGYRGELIRLLLTTGVVSYDGLHMLSGEHRLYTRKLKEMEEEGIVDIARLGKKKAARLQYFDSSYEMYIDNLWLGYYGHYKKYGAPNGYSIGRYGSSPVAAERSYRESEIVEMMYGAEVSVLPEDKKQMQGGEKIESEEVCFYSNSEIQKGGIGDKLTLHTKNTDSEEESISSRIIGVLISPGGKYAVYHTGNKLLTWKKSSEGQMSYFLAQVLNVCCANPSISGGVSECIIIGYSNDVFLRLMENERKTHVRIDSGYEHMYALPYTDNGRRLLSFMTQKDWKDKMKHYCLSDYSLNSNTSTIECDGTKENKIALVFCIPDISRLYRYISALSFVSKVSTLEWKYEVYCFDFQMSMVEALVDGLAEIKEIDFEGFCNENHIT